MVEELLGLACGPFCSFILPIFSDQCSFSWNLDTKFCLHAAGAINVYHNFEHLGGNIIISNASANQYGGAMLRSSSWVFGGILRWKRLWEINSRVWKSKRIEEISIDFHNLPSIFATKLVYQLIGSSLDVCSCCSPCNGNICTFRNVMWPVVQFYFSNISDQRSCSCNLDTKFCLHAAGGIYVYHNFEHLGGNIIISNASANIYGGAMLRSSSWVFGGILRWKRLWEINSKNWRDFHRFS